MTQSIATQSIATQSIATQSVATQSTATYPQLRDQLAPLEAWLDAPKRGSLAEQSLELLDQLSQLQIRYRSLRALNGQVRAEAAQRDPALIPATDDHRHTEIDLTGDLLRLRDRAALVRLEPSAERLLDLCRRTRAWIQAARRLEATLHELYSAPHYLDRGFTKS